MAKKAQYSVVDSKESFEALLTRVRQAQQEFARYSQERVDAIFKAAAMAANQARIPLAKEAVAETGMGVVEDKVIKNHYASEYIYNTYKNVKTCGVVEEDPAFGVKKLLEPVGVIGAVIPPPHPPPPPQIKVLQAPETPHRHKKHPPPPAPRDALSPPPGWCWRRRWPPARRRASWDGSTCPAWSSPAC